MVQTQRGPHKTWEITTNFLRTETSSAANFALIKQLSQSDDDEDYGSDNDDIHEAGGLAGECFSEERWLGKCAVPQRVPILGTESL